MSLAEYVNGIGAFIEVKFPGAVVHFFQEPDLPVPGEFAVSLKQEIRRMENRDHTLIERQYTVHCYEKEAQQAVLAMEMLSRYVMNEQPAVSIGDTPKILRMNSFTIDSPERLDSGLVKCSGTIQVQTREPVMNPQHVKIGRVEIRTT